MAKVAYLGEPTHLNKTEINHTHKMVAAVKIAVATVHVLLQQPLQHAATSCNVVRHMAAATNIAVATVNMLLQATYHSTLQQI